MRGRANLGRDAGTLAGMVGAVVGARYGSDALNAPLLPKVYRRILAVGAGDRLAHESPAQRHAPGADEVMLGGSMRLLGGPLLAIRTLRMCTKPR